MKIRDFLDLNINGFYKWETIANTEEFIRMKGCEQNPYWHAEGDVWEHTKKVCDAAIAVVTKFAGMYYMRDGGKEEFLAAALFHDIGKPNTTTIGKDGKIHSYGHEFEGEKLTRVILWDEDVKRRERVCALIKWHMEILEVLNHKNYLERIVEISKDCNIGMLLDLKHCDLQGSLTYDPGRAENYKTLNTIRKIADTIGDGISKLPLMNQINNYATYGGDKIYVMVGLPGSGKSTWISEHCKKGNMEDNGTNWAIVSRDLIRVAMGICEPGKKAVGTREQEEAVSERFDTELLDAVESHHTVIIDNINLSRKYRDKYKELLRKYNLKWVYVYMQAPTLDDNKERRKSVIEPDVFDNMVKRFDWPIASEYDELIIKVSDEKLD